MENVHSVLKRLTAHHAWFVLFSIVSLVPFGKTLTMLGGLSLRDGKYSHVLLIPLMSASLVYLQRKKIFTGLQYCPSKSAAVLVLGVVLFGCAQIENSSFDLNDHLSLAMLAIILVWMAGFILCYGASSFRAALFPWLFLLLMIPIPTAAMDKTVRALQEGSAVMTYALFKLLGMPVLWQGFQFSLPGVEIEIAKECSGVRSSLALFITSILAGHVFLQSIWRKSFFALFTVPVVIFKNAVRIVTISSLGVYVDPSFLHGRLHRYGGLPFSVISLAIMVASLFVLQKGEHQSGDRTMPNPNAGKGKGTDPTLAARAETA